MKEHALLLHCRRADPIERYKILELLYICVEQDYGVFWGEERACRFVRTHTLHNCMDTNIDTTYVVESHEGMHGFAVTTPTQILYLFVLPPFRGRGIGRRLLNYVEGTMFLKAPRIEAEVFKLNRSGLELFLSGGWKMVTFKETEETVTLVLERRAI